MPWATTTEAWRRRRWRQGLPTPASAAAIGDVAETVTGAQGMPGPAETEENSAQVQEVPALVSDSDVGNGSDKETEVQEVREVIAMASLDTAEDTVPEVADTESRHTCKTCGKIFDSKKKLYVHNKTHVPKWCFICGKEFNGQNFSRHQVSQEERR